MNIKYSRVFDIHFAFSAGQPALLGIAAQVLAELVFSVSEELEFVAPVECRRLRPSYKRLRHLQPSTLRRMEGYQ